MGISFLEKLVRSIIPAKSQKKQKYSSWDESCMLHAIVSATRSKDPNTQVGAYIVDPQHRPISLGYNGMPKGSDDDKMPWASEGEPLHIKDYFVVHAEKNAIHQAQLNSSLEGATIYATLFPCNNCAQDIAQKGISKVVYLSNKKSTKDRYKASQIILHNAGIKMEKFEMTPEFETLMKKIKEVYQCNF